MRVGSIAKSRQASAKTAFEPNEPASDNGRQKPQSHDDMIIAHARASFRTLPGACLLLNSPWQLWGEYPENDAMRTTGTTRRRIRPWR